MTRIQEEEELLSCPRSDTVIYGHVNPSYLLIYVFTYLLKIAKSNAICHNVLLIGAVSAVPNCTYSLIIIMYNLYDHSADIIWTIEILI